MGSRLGASPAVMRDASAAQTQGAAERAEGCEDTDPLERIRTQSIDHVLAELGSGKGGLSSQEAAARQQKSGKNLIESAKKRSPLLAFLSNFTHLMAILLWVAGAIAFFAGMPELGVAVWLVNVINGCFSFWQEYRAGKADIADYNDAKNSWLSSESDFVRSKYECLFQTRLLDFYKGEDIVF